MCCIRQQKVELSQIFLRALRNICKITLVILVTITLHARTTNCWWPLFVSDFEAYISLCRRLDNEVPYEF